MAAEAPAQGFLSALLSPLYSSHSTMPSPSPTTTSPSTRHTEELPIAAKGQLTVTSTGDLRESNSSAVRQGRGFLTSPFRSASSSIVAGAGSEAGTLTSTSPSTSAPSTARQAAASDTPLSTLPPPSEQVGAKQQQQQHGSGACAPHMLGYRQCLEVNPDFKTNCTWALDNYMRCKEDTEL